MKIRHRNVQLQNFKKFAKIFLNNLYDFYKVEYQIKSYIKLKIMNMLFHEVLFEFFVLSQMNLKFYWIFAPKI